MPINNPDIVRIFNQVADLLEISGANEFRVRAYRNAARTVGDQPQSVAGMLAEGKELADLPGIGKDLAGKIAEIVETGSLAMLDELEEEVPAALSELLTLTQLGPKRAAAIHQELGVRSLEDLAEALEQGKIRQLEGFGEKSEQKLRRELERHQDTELRAKLAEAEQIVAPLLADLESVAGVEQVVAAGSYRRRKETVGDLDILVTCGKDSPVMDHFKDYEDVEEVIASGRTKSTVRLRSGLNVDLRVVAQESYGAALYYFTGSKAHNVAVRRMAVDKGLKINEYGVFKDGNDHEQRIAGRTEAEVFETVGLPYIAPELREDQGEIQAVRDGRLPELIERDAIRGDLHAHTKATDGRSSLEEMVEAARDLGYSYLAITEHSQAVTVAKGLDRKRLEEQIATIDALTDEYSGFRILKGIEVDILEDGSLDLPDAVLEKLDLTVCSVHSKFDLDSEKQTERILRAMDNPHFNILAHPSGRLINERDPYQVDMERLMEGALERGCFLELNGHPDRLDLTAGHCRMARDMGLKVVISTDAHYAAELGNMRYGIFQARRGWLSADDVVNTRRVADLLRLLKRP